MDLRPFFIWGIIIIALIIGIVCIQAPQETPIPTASITIMEPVSPAATSAASQIATKEEMVAFVKEVVAYF